jgi:hypothetical protein
MDLISSSGQLKGHIYAVIDGLAHSDNTAGADFKASPSWLFLYLQSYRQMNGVVHIFGK